MSATADGRRTVLVTGASSGVGAAIGAAFGTLGWSVAVGARRVERVEELAGRIDDAGGRAHAGHLDVTHAESIDSFFAAAERALGPIDTVVSNAGVGVPGLLHELAPADLEREMATNLLGTMLVTRRALPSMLENGRGDLVFLSSMAVVEPRPFQAGYAAGKAGIEAMARTLRQDLEGTGVRTTVIRLGPTRSEFGFGWDPELLTRVIESWEQRGFMRYVDMLEPEEVAQVIVGAVTAPTGVASGVIELNPVFPREES